MLQHLTIASLAALGLTALASSAQANDPYVSGSIGLLSQSDSSNVGSTGAFTTGNLGDGSTLDVAAGTDYGWDTEFDTGAIYGLELGNRYGAGLRVAIEGVISSADVDTHTDVTLGGGAIGALDAASIASSADPLGVTVAQVVADGQGRLKNTSAFVNAYYDFNQGAMIQPYVGLGIGFSDVDVEYRPSDIGVINDGQTKFAYQGKLGLTLDFDGPLEAFGEVAYRATGDVETDNDLFPGTLDIENKATSVSLGLRYRFGG